MESASLHAKVELDEPKGGSSKSDGGGDGVGGGALGGAPTSTSIADTARPRVAVAMAGLARAVLVSVSTSSTVLPSGMAMIIDMENSNDSESRRLPENALPCDSLIRLPLASRTVIVTYAASTPEALANLVLMSSTTDGFRNSSNVPVTLSSTTTDGGGGRDGGDGGDGGVGTRWLRPEQEKKASRQVACAQVTQPGVLESVPHSPRQLVVTQYDCCPAQPAQPALSELLGDGDGGSDRDGALMPEHSRNAPRQAASAQATQPGVVESAAHSTRQLVATQWGCFPAHSAQSALSE